MPFACLQTDSTLAVTAFLPFVFGAFVTAMLFGTQWLVELLTKQNTDSQNHFSKRS
jgi:hypothetical protein